MKQLLVLCIKNVHFTFNGETYIQKDGVAMGSPLGPVLANVFMSHLEETIVPKLKDVKFWKRYVDDTIAIVKNESTNNILHTLNNFHNNIKFTFEEENNRGEIPFLDVLLMRKDNKIETCVYRKKTNTDLYLQW